MPNRILREGILTSEPVASLAWAEEVFYRRLQSIVDDYGRYEASAQLLRSKCYPLHTDAQVKAAQVWKWLEACAMAGLVVVYSCAGKTYLEVKKFGQQQRTKSKYPTPPSIDSKCTDTNGNEHLGVFVFGVVSEGVGEIGASHQPPTPKATKTKLPADFAVSERVKAWADERGFGQLEQHLEAFRRKAVAKGYAYESWDDAFMEAIREDWAKLRGRATNGAAPPPEHTARKGPDPALSKIKADALRAAAPSLETLERMAKIRQGAH